MYFIKLHHFFSVHLLSLVKRSKLDVLRRQGLVGERALDRVQIVGSDGNKSALSCKVLVKLVLEGNERLIARFGELDIPQDGTGEVWSYLRSLGGVLVTEQGKRVCLDRYLLLDGDSLDLAIGWWYEAVVWEWSVAEEDVQVHGNALKAQHVIS